MDSVGEFHVGGSELLLHYCVEVPVLEGPAQDKVAVVHQTHHWGLLVHQHQVQLLHLRKASGSTEGACADAGVLPADYVGLTVEEDLVVDGVSLPAEVVHDLIVEEHLLETLLLVLGEFGRGLNALGETTE